MTHILGNDLLRGDSVVLNRVTQNDLPKIVSIYSDLDFNRHLMRRDVRPFSLEDVESWFRNMADEFGIPVFAIRALTDDSLIGLCAFKDVRWASRHTFFWIGIDPAMRGKGYGPDATRVLLKYAFLELNLNCVGLEVFAYNTAAIAAYEKVGFQHDGQVRAYIYRDGVYYDMLLMSMVRDEWEARYGQSARGGLT
jgi:RimJ/RimL family protein N-acetyltransferase